MARLGRAQRQFQLRPYSDPGLFQWGDSDPDMMELPEMIDMGNWRARRKW